MGFFFPKPFSRSILWSAPSVVYCTRSTRRYTGCMMISVGWNPFLYVTVKFKYMSAPPDSFINFFICGWRFSFQAEHVSITPLHHPLTVIICMQRKHNTRFMFSGNRIFLGLGWKRAVPRIRDWTETFAI